MSYKNRPFLLRLTFIISVYLSGFQLFSQDKAIKGKLIDSKGFPMDAATIITPKGEGSISKSDGTFIIPVEENKRQQQLNIRRLGYETIDTLINLHQKDTTRIKIVLQEKTFRQDPVEITADRLNIFQRNNWVVLDYAILNGQFIFLYKKKRKRKLGLFDAEGFLIDEQSLIEKYNDIQLSCTQTILLNNKWESAEYQILDKKMFLIKYHTRKEYDKLLRPCIAKINDDFFFKDYSNHNKLINYYTFPSPKKPEIILSISDSIAAQVADSYYQDILIAYTNFVRGNYSRFRKNHRDVLPGDDISKLHLINDNLWSGDLKQLIVDDITFDLISQYELLESKPLHSGEFVKDNNLYLMDFTNKKLICVNSLERTYTSSELKNFNWEGSTNIITDYTEGSIYLLNTDKIENNILYQIILSNNQDYYLKRIATLNIEGDKQDRILIDSMRLYYLAKYTKKSTQFKWIDLNRYLPDEGL